eukprot:tig00021522_g22102.t1
MFDGERTVFITSLREVQDASSLISLAAKGVIRSVNRHACALFGYSAKELVGQRIEMLMVRQVRSLAPPPRGPARLPPALRPLNRRAVPYSSYHQSYLDRYMQTREAHVIGNKRRVEGKRRDGSTFPLQLEVSETRVATESGDVETIFIGRLEQLTEDEGNEAVITINSNGIIQSSSSACSQVFGYRTSELAGRNVRMLMPSHYAVRHNEFLQRYMETGIAKVIDQGGRSLEGLHKDGSVFPIELKVRRDDSMASQGVTLFVGTVTSLADVDGIITIDEAGTITAVNKNACKLFGYRSTDELTGRNVKKLMPDRYAVEHDGYLKRYLTTREKHVIGSKRELQGLHADNSEFPLTLEVSETTVDGHAVFTARILRIGEASSGSARSAKMRSGGLQPAGGGGLDKPRSLNSMRPSSLTLLPGAAAGAGRRGGDGALGAATARSGRPRRGRRAGACPPRGARAGTRRTRRTSTAPTGPRRRRRRGRRAAGSDGEGTAESVTPRSEFADDIGPLPPPRAPAAIASRRRSDVSQASNASNGRRRSQESVPSSGEAAAGALAGRRAPAPAPAGPGVQVQDLDASTGRAPGPRPLPSSPPAATTTATTARAAAAAAVGAAAGWRGRGGARGAQDRQQRIARRTSVSASSVGSAGRRRRARRRALLGANKKAWTPARRLRVNIVASMAVVLVTLLAEFIAVDVLHDAFESQIGTLRVSGEVAIDARLVAIEARDVQTHAAAREVSALSAAAGRLAAASARTIDAYRALTLGLGPYALPTLPALIDLLEAPLLNVTEYQNTVPPRALEARASLNQLTQKFVQAAQQIATAANYTIASIEAAVAANGTAASAASAASSSGSRAPEAWRCLEDPTSCVAFQYVMRNAHAPLLPATIELFHLYASQIVGKLGMIRLVYVVAFCAVVGIAAGQALLVFLPTFREIRRERQGVMKLFHHIPKVTLMKLARTKINIRLDSEEEDDEYDLDDEDGPPAEDKKKEEEKKAKESSAALARRVSFVAKVHPSSSFTGTGAADGKGGTRTGPKGAVAPELATARAVRRPTLRQRFLALFRRGKGAASEGPRLHSHEVQFLVFCAIVGACFVGILVVGLVITNVFVPHVEEIQEAAERAVLSLELVRNARELTLDASREPTAGVTAAELRARLLHDGEDAETAHRNLVARGTNGMTEEGIVALTYTAGCLRRDPAACLAESDALYPTVARGLDALHVYLLDQIALLVADAEAGPAAGPNAGRPADSASNARERFARRVGRAELLEAHGEALDLYAEAAVLHIAQLPSVHGAVMGVTIAVLVLFFWAVLRPMVRRIGEESRRSTRMLQMIPPEVAEAVQAVKDFLDKAAENEELA